MKPNIFLSNNLKSEDRFTTSLCYILNLFKKELGNRFLQKLSTLAGKSESSLGDFDYAEFTGLHYPDVTSSSKPDMVIYTSKTILFFENKLEAPLSSRQLERHLNEVRKANGKLIFVSNKKRKIPTKVSRNKYFLTPKDNQHFFWTDLMSVFENASLKGSLPRTLLKDFLTGLRINGIKTQELFGAEGSLYTDGSAAKNLALDQLQAHLKEIGWKASRKSTEHTLRVYHSKYGVRPLFNPRFYATGEWLDESLDKECILVTCLCSPSNRMKKRVTVALSKLEKRFPNIKFIAADDVSEGDLGDLYMPLCLRSKKRSFEIDWTYIIRFWTELYKALK